MGIREVSGHMEPRIYQTDANDEFHGVGTLVPQDITGEPVIHMHGSVGHNGISVTGCFRECVTVSITMEVVIQEILGGGLVREFDPVCGVRTLVVKEDGGDPGQSD